MTPEILSLFCFLSAENITAKHIVSNDSSDSDDESQGPKGKRAGNSSGRTALGKTMNVLSDFLTQDTNGSLCLRHGVIEL